MAEDPITDIEDVAEEVVGTLRRDLLGRDGYLVVLILTVVAMLAIPIDEEFRGGAVVTSVILGALVVVTMTRSQVPQWLRNLTLAVVAVSVAVAMTETVQGIHATAVGLDTEQEWVRYVAGATYTVVLALCFPAIMRRALSRQRITLNTLAAAIASYLLIGLIFTSLFRWIAIVHRPFFNRPVTDAFIYEYFSFITLTTVGYGDFTPANDAGRTLAMLEAVGGQIFLVVILALVVSNLGRQSHVITGGPSPNGPVEEG
jgi:hypothetical protein